MHDPRIVFLKREAFTKAEALEKQEPSHELLKYKNFPTKYWDEFLKRFGGSATRHEIFVAHAYDKYRMVLEQELNKQKKTAEFHNSLDQY